MDNQNLDSCHPGDHDIGICNEKHWGRAGYQIERLLHRLGFDLVTFAVTVANG